MVTLDLNHPCPFCGAKLECVTGITGNEGPKPGDISMCITCGEWLTFGSAGKIRKPTVKDYETIVRDPTCEKMRAAWLAMDKERRGEKKPEPPREAQIRRRLNEQWEALYSTLSDINDEDGVLLARAIYFSGAMEAMNVFMECRDMASKGGRVKAIRIMEALEKEIGEFAADFMKREF